MILVDAALALLAAYLGFGVVYQLFYAATAYLPQPEPVARDTRLRRIAILIAAYREDRVIVETARRALKQRYPADAFEVVVLADRLRAATLAELRHHPVRVVPCAHERSTKSASLRAGLAALAGEPFDAVVVLDADNHMAPDFLLEIDRYLAAGFRAVQGQRTAPPTRLNEVAQWDAIAEAINNHILCAGHAALGLSPRLAGSGMAFCRSLFAEVMAEVDAVGGFDKELELRLTQRGIPIAYAARAVVYDEKVADAEVFARQRGRWLAAQYRYAGLYLGPGLRALVTRGQVDFGNKALQMALPPRLLLPVALLGLTTVTLAWSTAWSAMFAGLLLLSALTLALAIPATLWPSASWLLLSQLPELVWQACRSVALIPASAKTFYHTPKSGIAAERVGGDSGGVAAGSARSPRGR